MGRIKEDNENKKEIFQDAQIERIENVARLSESFIQCSLHDIKLHISGYFSGETEEI